MKVDDSVTQKPKLRHNVCLNVQGWSSYLFAPLLGVGSMSLLIWCVSLALMLLGMLSDRSLVLLFMLSLASPGD